MSSLIFDSAALQASYQTILSQIDSLGFDSAAKSRLQTLASRIARFENTIIDGDVIAVPREDYPYDKEGLQREFLDEVFAEIIRVMFRNSNGSYAGLPLPASIDGFDIANFNNTSIEEKINFLNHYASFTTATWAQYVTDTFEQIKTKTGYDPDVNYPYPVGGGMFPTYTYDQSLKFQIQEMLGADKTATVAEITHFLMTFSPNIYGAIYIPTQDIDLFNNFRNKVAFYKDLGLVNSNNEPVNKPSFVELFTNIENLIIDVFAEGEKLKLGPLDPNGNPVSTGVITSISPRSILVKTSSTSDQTESVDYDRVVTIHTPGDANPRSFLIPKNVPDGDFFIDGDKLMLTSGSTSNLMLEVDPITLEPLPVLSTPNTDLKSFSSINIDANSVVTLLASLETPARYTYLVNAGGASKNSASFGSQTIVKFNEGGTEVAYMLPMGVSFEDFKKHLSNKAAGLYNASNPAPTYNLLKVNTATLEPTVSNLPHPVTSTVGASATTYLAPMQYLFYWNDARVAILKAQLNYREAIVSEIQEDLRQANLVLAQLEDVAASVRAQTDKGDPNMENKSETLDMDLWEAMVSNRGTQMFNTAAGKSGASGSNVANDDSHNYGQWAENRTNLKTYIDRKSSEAQQAMLDYQTMLNRYNNAFEVMGKIQEKLQDLVRSQHRNFL